MIRLENWSLVQRFDPYKAPEAQPAFLQGAVYGHPNFNDGDHIVTSKIVNQDIPNGHVITYSGTKYSLGKPSRDWVSWLKKHGWTQYIADLEKLTSRFVN
jgi:hypothetical protein